jgi:hypothetical protein
MKALLSILTLLIAAPAAAAPLFFPMSGGTAQIQVEAAAVELDADGIPTTPLTASVSLIDHAGAVVHCEPLGAGERKWFSFGIANNETGRVIVSVFAHAGESCTGPPSIVADDVSVYFFIPPLKPRVVE